MSKSLKGLPVYVNVYDLHPNNLYVHWMGLGAYHSGVEVLGREWTFGQHDDSSSGVFEHSPEGAGGAIFREKIFVGNTKLNSKDIDRVLDRLRLAYPGNEYHMLRRNCNHFASDFCSQLGVSYPSYLNRLSGLARCCSCCLPAWVNGGEAPVNEYNTRPREISTPSNVVAHNSQTGEVKPLQAAFSFSNSKGYSLLETKEDSLPSSSSLSSTSISKLTHFFGSGNHVDEAAKKEKMREAHLTKLGAASKQSSEYTQL